MGNINIGSAGSTPTPLTDSAYSSSESQESINEVGKDGQGRDVKSTSGDKYSAEGTNSTSQKPIREREISLTRSGAIRDKRTTQKTRAAVNKALQALREHTDVKNKAEVLNGLTPIQREVLSQNPETPAHFRHMLNSRILSDKLNKFIPDTPEGLFRKNTSITSLNTAIQNMNTVAFPNELIDYPVQCGNLFKKFVSQEHKFDISSFKGAIKSKKGENSIDAQSLTKKLSKLVEKLNPEQKDSLKINLSIMKKAVSYAPTQSDSQAIVSKTDLLGVLSGSLFNYPVIKKPSKEKIDAQKELGSAVLNAILNMNPKDIGL